MADDSHSPSTSDRAAGAIMGALIGDALCLGCHWYYDLSTMRKTFGDWISDYTTPQPGHYHEGCEAGDVSQTGQLLQMLLESMDAKGRYDQGDYCDRLDGFLETLDGTRNGGRYTAKDMCDVWKQRVVEGKEWGECGSPYGDTTDACVRGAALAGRYHGDLSRLAVLAKSDAKLQYKDPAVQIQAMSFAIIIGSLINGQAYDESLGTHLRDLVKQGVLPYTHAVLPGEDPSSRDHEGEMPEPDSLLHPNTCIRFARDPTLQIEPAWKIAQVYGMSCAFYMVMPGAYYLAGRYTNDFEMAVLSAVNGGGQNLARASLVGALTGAINGLSGIPPRFIEGLIDGPKWVDIATRIAEKGIAEANKSHKH